MKARKLNTMDEEEPHKDQTIYLSGLMSTIDLDKFKVEFSADGIDPFRIGLASQINRTNYDSVTKATRLKMRKK